MRRKLGWLLVLTLLVGGAAACGDDDGDGGDTTTTEQTDEGGDSGDGGDAGGNEAIEAFCDSVQELVDKSAELQDDPTNSDLQQEVTQLSTDLGTQGAELAAEMPNFTPEDSERFQGCQTDLSGIGPG
ncbi:MAG TPA: hypothetical protein VEW93_10860 [Acidimicrobiales bacterium]|nr:hypothetical protein [Acidimicrobiales bacterium]